ncbi:glycerol kinase, partial [Candidatus Uhrbacteria bacterium]|nr:glycerol kinase [Candidatus Uhrbacteria bacterium]MBD3284307.1 glycerol kinase [Candidatus Uhrbacteria bacterium]
MNHYLVLDVGTTGVKAFVFNERLEQVSKTYAKYPLTRPKNNWVEQDPKKLLNASKSVLKKVVKQSKVAVKRIVSFGITNQR